MSLSSDEFEINDTSPDSDNADQEIESTIIPEKSKEKYLTAYDNFIIWKNKKKASSFSESVLLDYFEEIAAKYKPSSLWATYSMLKSTLKSKNCINIESYVKLTAFLKKQSDGFTSKKSKVLTVENVEKFIDEAPDYKYLATKVALILGVTGGLRRQELSDMTINDIEPHGEILLIKIPHKKNKVYRSFVVHGKYCDIVKKYQSLRSKKGTSSRFFQQFRDGKCTAQVIGKNKFGSMPKEIAKYLNLPDAKSYTGHSFRQTSATFLADSGADMRTLKRHRGKSKSVAEGSHISAQITNYIFKSSENAQSGPTTSFAEVELEPLASSPNESTEEESKSWYLPFEEQ